MNTHDLSLCDLRAVAAVASLGHFGRAADALRLSQPTLSARVQKVECALGATLFERAARRFLITPEGQRLLPLLRETLLAAEKLHTAASANNPNAPIPALRLGVIPTLGPYLMPHLLLPLRRALKSLTLTITEQTTAHLVEALLDGTLDAALLSLPLKHNSLETLPLFEESFRLVAPRGSSIAAVDRLVPSRLCPCDMVLLEDGHCLRDQAIAVCSKKGGVTPRMVTTSLETLKYLVASGSGYSLLPALACSLPPGLTQLIQIRDFDDNAPSRRIGLCFRKSLAHRAPVITLATFIQKAPPPDTRSLLTAGNYVRVRAQRNRYAGN
jgi:LysR family transcriptional regulator, hydrogen peroxide-inducible genes activator